MRVVPLRSRAARKAAKKGELLTTSDIDSVYRMPDGEIVVVMMTSEYRRRFK